MSHLEVTSGLGLRVSAREDGTLEAAYIQVSAGEAARTEELIPSVLLVDFDEQNNLIGIELLAPVKISQVLEVANRLSEPQRDAFNRFVRNYAPPALVTNGG
jgi:uncharacterized protein YuzE